IAAIGPDPIVERLGPDRQGAGSAPVPVVDLDGALVLPGFVEAHTHLDKTLWGLEWRPHAAGPALEDKIDDERRMRREIDLDPARQSARLVALAVAHGSTHIRSHVDIDTEQGLRGIEGVMATREASAAQVDIELVAFPQSGLLRRPGTFELMEAALRAGVEVVGGLDPCAIDRDPKGHLDAIFDLAHRHGRAIDIHLHEPGEMGAFSLELIFERVRALGMQGRVVVSHAFCLGSLESERVEVLIEQLSALQIAIMTTGPAARPTPPVKRLLEAGVRVCAGSDGVRDAWSPYGNADMLERAMLIGLRNNFRRDEDIALALHACTQGGADALQLPDYGLRVGGFADLVVVAGESVAQAVAARPPRQAVVKRGRIVARNGAVCDVRP
ncbi:MAG: amidohydrolase family protein, partial [Burkholderiaceae bacterium]